MTRAPAIATLDTIFVARFYRAGTLIHSQTGTLTELAVLCAKTGNIGEIAIGDGEPLGQMAIHGRMLWFADPEHCASGMHKALECPARSPGLCTGANF